MARNAVVATKISVGVGYLRSPPPSRLDLVRHVSRSHYLRRSQLATRGQWLILGYCGGNSGTISASSAPEFKNFYTIDQAVIERFEGKWKPFRECRSTSSSDSERDKGADGWSLFPGNVGFRVRAIGVAQAVVNIVTDLSICLAMLWTLFRARVRVRGDSV